MLRSRPRVDASTWPQTIARPADAVDLHKEWCNEIFVSRSLEFDLVIRATIKPAYQRRFPTHRGFALWLTLSFLFERGRLKPSRRSPATGLDLNRLWVVRDSCCHCS